MFPSEAYRELCIENQKVLREEWEPKPGDWVRYPDHPHYPKVWEVGLVIDIVGEIYPLRVWPQGWYEKEHLVPLFQPRQLIEMIEEKGYYPSLQKCRKPVEWWAGARARAWDKWPTDTEITIQGLGPDPATALLKAYLEVVKEQEIE